MTLDNIKIEESLVDELRQRLKGQMTQKMYEDDNVFKRFLRARNHNIDAAEKMLKNHVNWRNENKVDTILTDDFKPHPVMASEYMPLTRLGTDIEGAPVSYVHFGCLDTKGLLNCCSVFEIQQFLVQFLETEGETMRNFNKNTGKCVTKSVYIFNFENFSLASATHKLTLETLTALITTYEAHFPETLKTAYAINVSYYFTLLWMVLKHFMSPATVDKIKIFGKTGWQEDLIKTINPDIIPAFLCGNLTDPDGNLQCKTLLKLGGPIPENLYAFNYQNVANRLPGATKINVQRMSKVEVTLQVLYPGSKVEWDFFVKSRDISYSVLFKDCANSDRAPTELIPPQRVETNAGLESGMCQCEKAGVYIIEFDNSYSWMYSKEIFYTATVVKASQSNATEF